MNENAVARLRITCPDKPGIVAAVTNFLASHGANITALDQHTSDPEGGAFFMRLEFQTPRLDVTRGVLEDAFSEIVARPFQMDWRIGYSSDTKKAAILVSGQETACWSCSGAGPGAYWTASWAWWSATNGAARNRGGFGVPFHYVPADGGQGRGEARNVGDYGAASTSWSWPATCGSFRRTSSPAFRRSSTSTTPFCPPSWARTPTVRPANAG